MAKSILLGLLGFVAVACGDDSTPTDAGTDARGRDASTDSMAADASTSDAGTDAGSDTGDDTGVADAGPGMGPLVDCVPSSEVTNSAWTDRLTVRDVTWCTSPAENTPLTEVLAGKARFWIAPGEYAYPPREVASGPFAFSVCAENKDGAIRSTPGSGTYSVSEDFGVELAHTLAFESGQTFEFTGFSDNDDWPGTELEGRAAPNIIFGNLVWVEFAGQVLAPCDGADWQMYRFGVNLEGGDEISVSFRGEAGSVSTGPSAGFRATGSIDGTAIDVSDHYRIIYSPGHHHFGGAFAVLFDAPIRGACGVRFNHVGNGTEEAALIGCDLTDLEPLVVESATRAP